MRPLLLLTALTLYGQSNTSTPNSLGSPLKKATYNCGYRLADSTAGQLSLTFTFVANTNKQLATIYHAAASTKTVLIRKVSIYPAAGALGVFNFEIRALNATTAPATGNPVITPSANDPADGAADSTCLALPTTAGSLVGADKPVSSVVEWNSPAASTITQSALGATEIVLYDSATWNVDERKPLKIRSGIAEGYAVNGRSTTAVALRFTVQIQFTEE